jgi:hypothetical protein
MCTAALRSVAIGLAALALTGCVQLLPRSHGETVTRWASFEEARASIEAIEPYRTTKADLGARGLDPRDPSVTLLSHVDIAGRFPMGGVLRADEVNPGIRDCLVHGKQCDGYLISVRHIHRDRVGNYWADAFNFKRETRVSGWAFNALVIFVDGVAVYSVYGGQPNIQETEISRNPLGPLQGWGERAGAAIPMPW